MIWGVVVVATVGAGSWVVAAVATFLGFNWLRSAS